MQEIFFSCKRNANGPCMCFWLGASSASIDQKLQKTPEEHTQQTILCVMHVLIINKRLK